MPKSLTDAVVYLEIIGSGSANDATGKLGVKPSFTEQWIEDGDPRFRWEINSRLPITAQRLVDDGEDDGEKEWVEVVSLEDHLGDIADQLSACWLELVRMTMDHWRATLYAFQPTALVNPQYGPVRRGEVMAGDWLTWRTIRLLASIDADLNFQYFSPVAHEIPGAQQPKET